MDIIIQNDGFITPFNIQTSRDTKFTVMPQTADSTEEKQAADGDIDFGTWFGMGEFNLHGIIEFDTIEEKNAILDDLRKTLHECRKPQKLYYEHSPERHRFIRLTGRPEIIPYVHHLEVRLQFKCDPFWHDENSSIAGSGITTVPDYIEVKDVSGKRIALLSPEADGLKEVYPDCRLNGESLLTFMLPANSEKINLLEPECTIWAGGRVYSLLDDENMEFFRDENNRIWAQYTAKERWHDLSFGYPEPYITNDPLTPHPSDLAVIIVSGGSDLSGGRYPVGTAGHALYAVLNGSGWSVGTVDVDGIHDLEMEKANRLELVKAIQNIWGGYLVWDSVNKTVSLRSGDTWQNYTGFQIRYAKNLKHITRTQSNRIITKLYVFGHDDLDIASVNDGNKYITNFSYINRELIGIYKNQDIYEAQELKDKASLELSILCRPRYLYSVKIADLRTLPEYEHEDFSVGDMVDIIDANIAPDSPRTRIVRHKYNLFRPWECEIELGDPLERFVEKLKASFDTSNFIDGKYNSNGRNSGFSVEKGTIGADKIKVNELVVGDNITMGPNARISWNQVTDTGEIPLRSDLTWNNISGKPTNLLTQEQLATALSDYVTTGTMTDALANTLNTGNFHTIIDKNYIASMNLVVGNEILMGENASISWVNVTNKPFIPSTAADVGALPDNTYIPTVPSYITSTKITQTTIESPNITGGTITGGILRTASTTQKRIVIDTSGITSYNGSYETGFYAAAGEYNEGAMGLNHNGVSVISLYWNGQGIGSLDCGGDLYISPGYGSYAVRFFRNVDFSNATVTGLTGFALSNHTHYDYASATHTHSGYATTSQIYDIVADEMLDHINLYHRN